MPARVEPLKQKTEWPPRAPAKPGSKRAAKKKPAKRTKPWPDGTPACPRSRGGIYGSRWKGEATYMHSLFVRARDGRCMNCGATEGLQCMHIMSRRYSATRTAEDNAIAGCGRCHRIYTRDGTAWARFLLRIRTLDDLDGLYARAANGVNQKFPEGFWYAEYLRLKAGLERIEGTSE